MDGTQLDACFGVGFSPVKAIQVKYQPLSVPAMPVTNHMADVQEQQHVVSAAFDGATGKLTIQKDGSGKGLWIPWLGQGSAQSGRKGWGTYTRAVTNKSWVATGPFSGCFAAAVVGSKRFAHLVTAGGGYTTASVDAQINAIKQATGAGSVKKFDMTGGGEGIAFFLLVSGKWKMRRAFVIPGSGQVTQISARAVDV